MKTVHLSIIITLMIITGTSTVFAQIGNPFVLGLASPLKQFKSGVKVQDVKCQPYYFILIIKVEDNSPACVTANTAFRLSEIGWGYLSSPITSKIDLLDSKITGGTITEFNYDTQSAIIIIKIQTTSDGVLTVTIPKVLTDLNPHYLFKTSTVLVDGMEADINKTATAKGPSFTIPFTNGTQEIEIIGNQVGQMN